MRMRGGETDMFGNLVQDAALVGVGAYAARNPDTPGMGIIANVGKFFLYAGIAVFALFIIVLIVVFIYGKPTNQATTTGTKEKLTMKCRPQDTPQDRDGQPGCVTGSGNWYASSTF
jgi:uncharacterized membrane protein